MRCKEFIIFGVPKQNNNNDNYNDKETFNISQGSISIEHRRKNQRERDINPCNNNNKKTRVA